MAVGSRGVGGKELSVFHAGQMRLAMPFVEVFRAFSAGFLTAHP